MGFIRPSCELVPAEERREEEEESGPVLLGLHGRCAPAACCLPAAHLLMA